MDTSVPSIHFDAQGECQYCRMHDAMEAQFPLDAHYEARLAKLVEEIKRAGAGKPYDCVCGTSGGRDSSWTLYLAKKWGLRPLAVHFDSGWNSEIAVRNVQRVTQKLNIDLETVVADWEEFKDVQLAFLKASVPDVDVPCDVSIHSVLHLLAEKEGIKYILNGHSFRTEGISPIDWTYMDGRYIRNIQKQFGTRPLRDFKNFGIKEVFHYSFVKGIKVVPILNYLPYNQAEVTEALEKELGWTYYGGHHHESYHTKFNCSYLLPKKFNIDKRRTECSALVRSGQMTRDQALATLKNPPDEVDDQLIDYVLNKFGLSREEWERILHEKPKSFRDYRSYYPLMKRFRPVIKVTCELNLLPKLLYLKYLG